MAIETLTISRDYPCDEIMYGSTVTNRFSEKEWSDHIASVSNILKCDGNAVLSVKDEGDSCTISYSKLHYPSWCSSSSGSDIVTEVFRQGTDETFEELLHRVVLYQKDLISRDMLIVCFTDHGDGIFTLSYTKDPLCKAR